MSEEEKKLNQQDAAEDTQEYAVFTITARDGSEKEMAVLEEFSFEKKDYAVCALIENDEIVMDGMYIYELVVGADSFTAREITDRDTYLKVVKAYEEM